MCWLSKSANPLLSTRENKKGHYSNERILKKRRKSPLYYDKRLVLTNNHTTYNAVNDLDIVRKCTKDNTVGENVIILLRMSDIILCRGEILAIFTVAFENLAIIIFFKNKFLKEYFH